MDIQVLATGLGWMGGGIESIHSNIEELVCGSQHEIMIGAYSIGQGALDFLDVLAIPLKRRVVVRMVINRFKDHPLAIQERLLTLMRFHLNLEIHDFAPEDGSDLHAKLVIVDRDKAVIGSSNLSRRGFVTNHELAVRLQGTNVRMLAQAFDTLLFEWNDQASLPITGWCGPMV